MKNIFILVLSAIILASCSPSAPLGFHLKEGEIYHQNMKLKATVVQNIQGQNMELIMTIGGDMEYKVLAAKDDIYELEVKYKSLTMEMQLPQGNMSYSSENPNELISRMLADMKDKAFEISMTKTGKVKEVRNMDNLFNTMMDNFPELGMQERAQIEAQLRDAFGEESFKGSIEMITAIFPEDPNVKLGDSWTITTELANTVTAEVKSTYTLKEENDNFRFISGNSTITSKEGDEGFTQIGGMSARYDLRGSMSSNIKLDPKTGWITEASVNQEITGKAIVEANAQMPQGMIIPIIMKNKMTITN